MTMRVQRYIAVIADAHGTTGAYVFRARTRRRAKRDAREWCERTDWGATIVSIKAARVPEPRSAGGRLLRVAGITFAASGITIAGMMVIGLSLEGAL